METTTFKYNHELVREKLEKMQSFGGAAIKPLALYDIFYQIIQDQSPSKMNRSKARDMVDTYCALCNEYFIINHFAKSPREDFFMSEERWAKYYLGQKARENSIKALDGWAIHTRITKNPCKPINKVRMYKIDLEIMNNFIRIAEENEEKRKQRQRNMMNHIC